MHRLLIGVFLVLPFAHSPVFGQMNVQTINWRPVIDKMVVNGRAVSIDRAVIKADVDQVAKQFQDQWDNRQFPVKLDRSDEWLVVSRIFQGQIESAQIRQIALGSSEVLKHTTALSPSALQANINDLLPQWITPEFNVSFVTQSRDQGQRAYTYLLATSLSPETALNRLVDRLKAFGYTSHPTANRSFKDQVPSAGLQVVMASAKSAHVSLQVMTTNDKTNVLVLYQP